ncbi:MAG: hypothetical protein K2X80_13910 [Pseudomonadaceae bacterium]|nr:hypothetical protein [Pseudomonadaceae bacterium]
MANKAQPPEVKETQLIKEEDGVAAEQAEWEEQAKLRKAKAIEALRKYLDLAELDSRRQRVRFAQACGTTWGNMQQILQAQRSMSLWLAVNLDRESDGALDMTEMFVESDPRHKVDWEHVRKAMRRKPTKA